MAHAPILQDRRQVRAAGIVERSEVIPVEDIAGLFQVRDSVSGSGEWHLASASTCDCYDAGKGNQCKHQRAVQVEERSLAHYCATWDARSEQQRDGSPMEESGLRCHVCNGPAESLLCHLGGRGTVCWAICMTNSSHPARRLS